MQILKLILIGCLFFSVLLLSGCVSTAEKEARENDPEYILGQAKQAYRKEDYQQAFQLLYPLAAAGNDQAQYTIGYLYHHGLGVEKNDQQAMNWIQRAAAKGNQKALKALKQK